MKNLSKKYKMCYNKNNQGYSLLVILVVISSISILVSTSILLLSVDFSRTSFSNQKSYQARYLALACAEAALQEIRNSTPFTGTDTINIGAESCQYTVTNTGGQNRNIQAQASVGGVVRKLEIDIDAINPDINVVSWIPVADF